MARKSELPKKRYHVMLYEEDGDFLEAEYGKVSGASAPIGMSEAICRIIHAKVLDLKAKAAAAFEAKAREGRE